MAAYGSLAGVAALCKHRTAAGDWSDSMGPSAAQVSSWLRAGYADMNLRIAKAGYTAPVTDNSIMAYDRLRHLNDLYAAGQVELAWDTARGAAEEETRGDRFLREYRDGMVELLAGDGTLIGLTWASTTVARRRIRMVNMRREDGFSEYTREIEEYEDDEP